MADMFAARKHLISELRGELLGPSPRGKEVDITAELKYPSYEAANGPFTQPNGEEVLTGDRPLKRYGIGVLYPVNTPVLTEPETSDNDQAAVDLTAADAGEQPEPQVADLALKQRSVSEAADEDLPLSTANSMRPSSCGVSFLADLPEGADLLVELTGGHYTVKQVTVEGRENPLQWFPRSPVSLVAVFTGADLHAQRGAVTPGHVEVTSGPSLPDGLQLEISLISRPRPGGQSLITVTAVNRSSEGRAADARCLFQAALSCEIVGVPYPCVIPYEERRNSSDEAELASLALLYRDVPAFAIGHGCSADWTAERGADRARLVRTEMLPAVEVPSTTPEILGEDGKLIAVPMAPLAGLQGSPQEATASLQAVIDGYGAWIKKQQARVSGLEAAHRGAAVEHLRLCAIAQERMQDGLAFLAGDEHASRAFALANEAMYLQQQRSGQPTRQTAFDRSKLRVTVEPGQGPDTSRGTWRPFQIAFVLASLRSTADRDAHDRETVELIFFPTGGGKTEAYLALTAFSIFLRRLRNSSDTGVDVLMRYTLRLLTAQQFQRAGALICAMDHLRARSPESLGTIPVSIGVWLGGSVTPNDRKTAVSQLKQLNKEGAQADNPFVLLRCPWCAAQMGPIEAIGKAARGGKAKEPKVAGYVQRGDTVALVCPDSQCEFNGRALPVYVIDTDVYEQRPSLVIGTVDKFAMLALRPQARALFGIADDGSRELGPPNLIIQDELHLISGPLGSMVGMYEGLIEELCTDRRNGAAARPKIVASTATIRRFEQQIRDLYCREAAALFPPRGLDASDSYFAQYATRQDGTLQPGRIYVGVHGPGLGSIQTAQVRTFATLLQLAEMLPDDERDPWWTLLVFFNSLRELGTSLSLLQSDIPDYLRVLRKRLGLEPHETRGVWNIEELTGRLRNDEVPRAIEKLEIRAGSEKPSAVDVCLASNIVEVGVDIDRLSLMTVVGQPKTTAQYIQATGRVGRRWWERPGLVATIYGASKPRDRSHFEKFRSYHERLYAQVEPTSATPFAPPVVDRALHAVVVAYVRQFGDINLGPQPVPERLIQRARDLLVDRVKRVDPEEAQRFEDVFDTRIRQWGKWDYPVWMSDPDSDDYALLRYAGAYADRDEQRLSWAVPTSLRNVDAECRGEVTKAYVLDEEEVA